MSQWEKFHNAPNLYTTAKEAFKNKYYHHNTMKTIAKTYWINWEFCTRGSLSFLPELKLRKIFPAVYFVNTNLPEGRAQVLISGNKLSPLPDNSIFFFNK